MLCELRSNCESHRARCRRKRFCVKAAFDERIFSVSKVSFRIFFYCFTCATCGPMFALEANAVALISRRPTTFLRKTDLWPHLRICTTRNSIVVHPLCIVAANRVQSRDENFWLGWREARFDGEIAERCVPEYCRLQFRSGHNKCVYYRGLANASRTLNPTQWFWI